MLHWISLLTLTSMTLMIASASNAADVIKIKGQNLLIDLKGESATPGDLYYTVNTSGKKVGVITVGKIKGDKAIAKLSKGKAEVGMTLERKSRKGETTATNKRVKSSTSPSNYPYWWGMMGGFAMDSMSVKVLWQKTVTGQHNEGDEKETSSLSGSGFSAKGLFDYDLGNDISIRGLGGIETFNVSGGSGCGPGNDSACTSKIIYLTGDGMARYLFSHKEVRPWAGLGLSLLFPLSASGTALDPASVGSTWMLLAGGGLDYFINPKMYIPISIEYGMFPPTDQVKAHWIALRAGFAVPY